MKTKPTKTAAKKTPKLTPIIIGGFTAGAIGYRNAEQLISALPTVALKEHLRARNLPIPKDKATMVARLAQWAVRPDATFTLSLY
jgi:hypothetical protein